MLDVVYLPYPYPELSVRTGVGTSDVQIWLEVPGKEAPKEIFVYHWKLIPRTSLGYSTRNEGGSIISLRLVSYSC